MVTVAQTPPAPKALHSHQFRSCPVPVPSRSLLIPASPPLFTPSPLPSVPWNSTHPWIWAQVTMPIFTFPNPTPCPTHVSGKCRGMRGWRRSPKAIEEGNPAWQQPCPVPLWPRGGKGLDGLGKLFLMVANMATLGRGLACYCSFPKKMESGLFWAGDRTSDPEAGQSRPGPQGKAFVYPCSQVRVTALPVPALPTCGCEKATRGSTALCFRTVLGSRYSPTLPEGLSQARPQTDPTSSSTSHSLVECPVPF